MLRHTLVALLVSAMPLAVYGNPMDEPQDPAGETRQSPLDSSLEPDSDAIVLSASHLFVIEVLEAKAITSWTRGADRLEHRTLHLNLRLIEKLKGSIRANKGDVVSVDVSQKREDALTVSDYHGFWSHAEIVQGRKYLAASNGQSTDLPTLLKEPSIKGLFDAALEQDVRLVIAAEKRFGGALRKEDGQRTAAARDLLQFANERRAEVDQLFSQYAWARIAPLYEDGGEDLDSSVLAIIEAPDSAIPLREALAYGLYDTVVSPQPSEQQLRLLRAFLKLLLQPSAAPMFDRLLQVAIYNLAFRQDRPRRPSAEVIASEAERSKMAAVASKSSSARAQAVAGWLAGR